MRGPLERKPNTSHRPIACRWRALSTSSKQRSCPCSASARAAQATDAARLSVSVSAAWPRLQFGTTNSGTADRRAGRIVLTAGDGSRTCCPPRATGKIQAAGVTERSRAGGHESQWRTVKQALPAPAQNIASYRAPKAGISPALWDRATAHASPVKCVRAQARADM